MDTALTVFILICASMVLFMTPGVAFFYGGLSRKKTSATRSSWRFSQSGSAR